MKVKPMKNIDSAAISRLIQVAFRVYPPVLLLMLVLGAKMFGLGCHFIHPI